MSKKYTLNTEDLQKILTGAVVAMVGALLTYVAQTIGEIDFGIYTPVVVAFSAILVNAVRKFITGK
jgi:hypothetical protein